MFEKISRAKWMSLHDGKSITFFGTAHMGAADVSRFMEKWEDKAKYEWAMHLELPVNTAGVLHKRSSSYFCRVLPDGDESYHYFEYGSYIMADGVFSMLFSPNSDKSYYNVTIYRNA